MIGCSLLNTVPVSGFPIAMAALFARAKLPRLFSAFIRRSGTLVKTEKRGSIVIIKINRPEKRNAVNVATSRELAESFRRFEVDDESSVAVLCGEGGTFCAGYDLEELSEKDTEEWLRSVPPVGEGDAPMVRILKKSHECFESVTG